MSHMSHSAVTFVTFRVRVQWTQWNYGLHLDSTWTPLDSLPNVVKFGRESIWSPVDSIWTMGGTDKTSKKGAVLKACAQLTGGSELLDDADTSA